MDPRAVALAVGVLAVQCHACGAEPGASCDPRPDLPPVVAIEVATTVLAHAERIRLAGKPGGAI